MLLLKCSTKLRKKKNSLKQNNQKVYIIILVQKFTPPSALKGIVHPKMKFCHHLLTLKPVSVLLLLNPKEDILKNVGN